MAGAKADDQMVERLLDGDVTAGQRPLAGERGLHRVDDWLNLHDGQP